MYNSVASVRERTIATEACRRIQCQLLRIRMLRGQHNGSLDRRKNVRVCQVYSSVALHNEKDVAGTSRTHARSCLAIVTSHCFCESLIQHRAHVATIEALSCFKCGNCGSSRPPRVEAG
jgi:hypothetical protein